MQREIASAVGNEVAKATPTAAVVLASAVFASELEFWLRMLMYLTAIILAIAQTGVAIKRWRQLSKAKPSDTDAAGA